MSDINRENNLTSFKTYYEANVSSMILFAQRFVPTDVAEDVIHDIFFEIWSHQDTPPKLPTRSYLFTALRNRCLNYLQKEKSKENYIQSAQLNNQMLGLNYYDSYEKLIIEQEDMQKIYDQIERLPEKCRVIFKMSYLEEKRNSEIAETLGISIRTVENQLYLGLRTLRSRLTTGREKRIFFMLFL